MLCYIIKSNSTLFYQLFLSCSLGNCSFPLSLRPDKLSLDGRPSNDPSKGATKWITYLNNKYVFFTNITYDLLYDIICEIVKYLKVLESQTYLLCVHSVVVNVVDQPKAWLGSQVFQKDRVVDILSIKLNLISGKMHVVDLCLKNQHLKIQDCETD